MASPTVEVLYHHKKTELKDVKLAMARRLMWSDERHNQQTDLSTKLTKVCDAAMGEHQELAGLSNRSTVGIGILGNTLMFAAQGFQFDDDQSTRFKARVLKAIGKQDSDYTLVLLDLNKLGLEAQCTGLHAEMMIVRYCVKTLGQAKNTLGASLTIACSLDKKGGCCPNCSGWMNAYSIPHTDCRDKLSDKWRHPITLALYESNRAVDQLWKKVNYTSPHIGITVETTIPLKKVNSYKAGKSLPEQISDEVLSGLQLRVETEDYLEV